MTLLELSRRLSIGFMDSLSLDKRYKYICTGLSVKEVLNIHPEEKEYQREVSDILRWLDKSPLNKIWWYKQNNYPNFAGIERHLPFMLFVKGSVPMEKKETISIVGTRNTDNPGFQMAYKLGLEASCNGISVVSGFADGCDQAALNGAVDGQMPAYAVIGCGHEIDYPKFSNRLRNRILEGGGAVISRFSPYTPPLKYNFPNRNVIISAFGDKTIVVQAPKNSGSLITADFTLQMGKDVFVSQEGCGKKWNRLGSEKLAGDGAPVIYSIDGIRKCKSMVFETEYANGRTFRFGNKLYILKTVRKM